MASIFLQALNHRKSQPVLSFLFFEVLQAVFDRTDESVSMQQLVSTTLVQTGQCTLQQLQENPALVLEVCERIKARKDRIDAEVAAVSAEKKQPKKSQRGFGTKFAQDFEELDGEGKCLFAADYDFERAREMYCLLDKDVASKIIKSKFDYVINLQVLQFEGVVFGMGGSFDGSGGGGNTPLGDVTTIDNSHLQGEAFDREAEAFMASLGR